MIYDKNNKYLPSFIVNHKYTINKMYLVRLMWWVSEIKCTIFKENNDNPYEINNIYIKLSIVFHPMLIFFRK